MYYICPLKLNLQKKKPKKLITIKKAQYKEEIQYGFSLIQKLAELEGESLDKIVSFSEFENQFSEKNPEVAMLLAYVEEQIAGMAFYYYRFSTWKGKHIHLEDLMVDENFRSKGIGKILLDEIISIAKKENLKRIEWELHSTNTNALKFYSKYGAEISEEWKICRIDL